VPFVAVVWIIVAEYDAVAIIAVMIIWKRGVADILLKCIRPQTTSLTAAMASVTIEII